MSVPWILNRLYTLDPSSLDFSRHLYSVIRHDEEEKYLSKLQRSELTQLLDFFDKALDTIPTTNYVGRECLRKLQAICGHHAILPSSYIISDEIARVGGDPTNFGDTINVWEGTYRGKKVSVKCLRAPSNDVPAFEKLFFREAVVWKRLNHPNLIPFIGVTTNPLQIISDWVPNVTLTEFIEGTPGVVRISLLLDVAEGLGYLHANHRVHGNLNGSSILVDHDGHARLADFELPSITRELNSVEMENGYATALAAPEILRGADTITPEADVFAFGMLVIEVFTGRHPFSEFAVPVVISKIMGGERPARPQEKLELGLTDPVWDITARCWDQDPAKRPNMVEVIRPIRECYRAATWMTKITDIPVRVLINNILSLCKVKDVLSLGCTNRFFALVVADENFWRQRVAVEYKFTGPETNSICGWKLIYQRLGKPQNFWWRMACLEQFPEAAFLEFIKPSDVFLESEKFVSLNTTWRALYAIDAAGDVNVLGTVGDALADHTDFSNRNGSTSRWLKLCLPAPTHSISCSWIHATTLDRNSTVWNLRTWGRPFQLVSSFLNCSSPETTPIQVESGSLFSAALTRSGDVYMWWPSSGTLWGHYKEAIKEMNKDESTKAIVSDNETAIPCHTFSIHMDPGKLPTLPNLPDLPATGLSEGERTKETKLIKIAATKYYLIGLTNKGHVLALGEQPMLTWHYLPQCSDIGRVKEHPDFHMSIGDNGQKIPPKLELPSDTMLITHVSAHSHSLCAYSSSMVFELVMGATLEALPTITLVSHDYFQLCTVLDGCFLNYSERKLSDDFQKVHWILKTRMNYLVGTWKDG